jgi:hypothetical protein
VAEWVANLSVYLALPVIIERVKVKLRGQDINGFSMVRLTYGFCSPELARAIPGRIDPRLDQHAAHERNRLGRPRLGAAVDFIADEKDMRESHRAPCPNRRPGAE